MLGFFDAILAVSGGGPRQFARRTAQQMESRIHDLVVRSFEEWRNDGFVCFTNHEIDFTAALIGHIDRIARRDNEVFRPRPETVRYSREILEGRADPRRAPRIDVTLWWGDVTLEQVYTIECKRLSVGALARAYVLEGMQRFISGYYAPEVSVGALIGFVIQGDPRDMGEVVNRHITEHYGPNSEAHLHGRPAIRLLESVCVSDHTRTVPFPPVRLTHLFFDLTSLQADA